ncbi:GIY-YIG nuclease family protein [Niabella soli]|uniref:Excinuclease ABC subunit C n=1 Tax=Niabella soli DSM 19437 TaxID=929713 RepID=W0F0Z4_9BACT|nr:GIY-YIG nuclease family protein [Niabella soli]AHF16705.1 excinuclease ABC subunit C [Niabella soli DSM 19437]
MPYTFYILYSSTLDKFYTGFTSGLLGQRLQKHLTNHSGFTARAKDWKCVFSEIYESKEEAQKREKEIKRWKSSKRIAALIAAG